MNRYILIALCVLLMTSFSQRSNANMLIEEEGTEILYFFSYHCTGCFAMKDYVSLWEKVSKNKIRRIPVFKENEWLPGAYIYAISTRINRTGQLGTSELDRINFATTMKYNGSNNVSRDTFLDFMLENNYHATPATLISAWNESEEYLEAVSTILDTVEKEKPINTPSARVSNGDTVIWVSLNNESENPGIDFVTKLNDATKRVKK